MPHMSAICPSPKPFHRCYENGQVPTYLGMLTRLGLPDCYDTPGMFWIDMDWFLQQYGLDCLDQVSYLQSGLCLAQTYSGPRVPVCSALLWKSRLTLDFEILVCIRLYLMYKVQTLHPYIKLSVYICEASLSTTPTYLYIYLSPQLHCDPLCTSPLAK